MIRSAPQPATMATPTGGTEDGQLQLLVVMWSTRKPYRTEEGDDDKQDRRDHLVRCILVWSC
jgi:hypothetical protein